MIDTIASLREENKRMRELLAQSLTPMSRRESKIYAAEVNAILSTKPSVTTDDDLNAVLEVEPGTGGE